MHFFQKKLYISSPVDTSPKRNPNWLLSLQMVSLIQFKLKMHSYTVVNCPLEYILLEQSIRNKPFRIIFLMGHENIFI